MSIYLFDLFPDMPVVTFATFIAEIQNFVVSTDKTEIEGSRIHIGDAFYIIDCAAVCTLPTIVFVFKYMGSTREIKLYGEDYVKKIDEKCHLLVSEMFSNHPKWILGVPFLSVYYTEFDMDVKQVLFAKSIIERQCKRNQSKNCYKN